MRHIKVWKCAHCSQTYCFKAGRNKHEQECHLDMENADFDEDGNKVNEKQETADFTDTNSPEPQDEMPSEESETNEFNMSDTLKEIPYAEMLTTLASQRMLKLEKSVFVDVLNWTRDISNENEKLKKFVAQANRKLDLIQDYNGMLNEQCSESKRKKDEQKSTGCQTSPSYTSKFTQTSPLLEFVEPTSMQRNWRQLESLKGARHSTFETLASDVSKQIGSSPPSQYAGCPSPLSGDVPEFIGDIPQVFPKWTNMLPHTMADRTSYFEQNFTPNVWLRNANYKTDEDRYVSYLQANVPQPQVVNHRNVPHLQANVPQPQDVNQRNVLHLQANVPQPQALNHRNVHRNVTQLQGNVPYTQAVDHRNVPHSQVVDHRNTRHLQASHHGNIPHSQVNIPLSQADMPLVTPWFSPPTTPVDFSPLFPTSSKATSPPVADNLIWPDRKIHPIVSTKGQASGLMLPNGKQVIPLLLPDGRFGMYEPGGSIIDTWHSALPSIARISQTLDLLEDAAPPHMKVTSQADIDAPLIPFTGSLANSRTCSPEPLIRLPVPLPCFPSMPSMYTPDVSAHANLYTNVRKRSADVLDEKLAADSFPPINGFHGDSVSPRGGMSRLAKKRRLNSPRYEYVKSAMPRRPPPVYEQRVDAFQNISMHGAQMISINDSQQASAELAPLAVQVDDTEPYIDVESDVESPNEHLASRLANLSTPIRSERLHGGGDTRMLTPPYDGRSEKLDMIAFGRDQEKQMLLRLSNCFNQNEL